MSGNQGAPATAERLSAEKFSILSGALEATYVLDVGLWKFRIKLKNSLIEDMSTFTRNQAQYPTQCYAYGPVSDEGFSAKCNVRGLPGYSAWFGFDLKKNIVALLKCFDAATGNVVESADENCSPDRLGRIVKQ
jgi:hypothetical protein